MNTVDLSDELTNRLSLEIQREIDAEIFKTVKDMAAVLERMRRNVSEDNIQEMEKISDLF